MATATIFLRNEPIIKVVGDGQFGTLHVSCANETNSFCCLQREVTEVHVEQMKSNWFVSVRFALRTLDAEISFTGYDIQDGDDTVAEPTPTGVEYYNQNALETHLV